MTTNEHLDGIEARIEDLQNTIAEKEVQIRERAMRLKEDLQTEISPIEIIRKHPFEVAGAILGIGFVVGRALRPASRAARHASAAQPASRPVPHVPPAQPDQQQSSIKSAMSSIGIDILRSTKELGFTYLQRYLDRKIR
ncbi:MAG: hypothetical protein K9I59_05365 [Chlorobium sp.]|jgi:hypothetical protein|uniref:hypothetical protein n=1 Tax=Chlorobium sp. TaxID=1095 RepID=UPI001DED6C91|nr:hypothetical protein [Chlorobium sp.]MBN1279070.1 hypothetical protein [Chlorobiaceae bacterium]MCF8216205.1 hypothetical protein [Chlorobium sp.]MCF8271068.1 hypothetical protein [Chlorobium sp.]MCF8287481.1 hypothetical protein [Chlorobium sp.]MCF8290981.1 hypothetical protein [Chlorobium sp.]